MPRWSDSGERNITTLFEAAAYQHTIKVVCRCGHVAILNPHALWWHFQRKGWDDRLSGVASRLRCSECPRRGWGTVTLTTDPVTVSKRPLPPLHEWKKAVNRFRN